MRTRGMRIFLLAAGIGLTATVGAAQDANQPIRPEDVVEAKTEDSGAQTPAEGGKEKAPDSQPKPKPPAGGDSQGFPWIMVIPLGLLVLMIGWSSRGRKKQEAKHRSMVAALKKGDKIVTIGGVKGTVMEARENEITVKVDETNNVRMKFLPSAIRAAGDTSAQTPGETK